MSCIIYYLTDTEAIQGKREIESESCPCYSPIEHILRFMMWVRAYSCVGVFDRWAVSFKVLASLREPAGEVALKNPLSGGDELRTPLPIQTASRELFKHISVAEEL